VRQLLDAFPVVSADSLPWLSVEQMREVDRLMIEDFRISLLQMMENAGRSLAVLVRALLGGDAQAGRIIVIAGSGGNGGGGMAAARHLVAGGADVEVRLTGSPTRLSPATQHQYESLRAIGLPMAFRSQKPPSPVAIVVDAALGYSQQGAPIGDAARLLRSLPDAPIVALDVPSGLELESGAVHDPHVKAQATLTLALPKTAMRLDAAVAVLGELYLADISVPPSLFRVQGIDYQSPFAAGPIVRVVGR
jgi:NAD(P)H-hydrate epimerase